jgi:hypothetical protein
MFVFIFMNFLCIPPKSPDIVEAPSKHTAIIDDQPIPNLECIILLRAVYSNIKYLYSCLFYLQILNILIDLLIYFSFTFFIFYLNYIVIVVDCVALKILYVI